MVFPIIQNKGRCMRSLRISFRILKKFCVFLDATKYFLSSPGPHHTTQELSLLNLDEIPYHQVCDLA